MGQLRFLRGLRNIRGVPAGRGEKVLHVDDLANNCKFICQQEMVWTDGMGCGILPPKEQRMGGAGGGSAGKRVPHLPLDGPESDGIPQTSVTPPRVLV